MMINHLKLENWKNFAFVDVDLGRRVFIIGPNASGKSNFLDALRFLRDVAKDGLEQAVMTRGGLNSMRHIGARQRADVSLTVTIDGAWRYSLTVGSERSRPSPLVVAEVVETVEKSAGAEKWKEILRRPDENDHDDPARLQQTALQQVSANKDFREIADFFCSIRYRHILPQLMRQPEYFLPNPVSDDPFGRDLVYRIWNTPEKTRQARLKRINKALQAAVPNFKDLTIELDAYGSPHFKVNYEPWPPGVYQNETSLSDGTLRLVAILWSLLEAGGPLLLEKPELALHEGIVAMLPALFAQVGKDKTKVGRQVFLTTHAEAMLKDIFIDVSEVLRLEPGPDGVLALNATDEEIMLMESGLFSAADVLTPKTSPTELESLRFF